MTNIPTNEAADPYDDAQVTRAFEDAAQTVVALSLGMLPDPSDVTRLHAGGFDQHERDVPAAARGVIHAHLKLLDIDTGDGAEDETDAELVADADKAIRVARPIVAAYLPTIARVASALLARGGCLSLADYRRAVTGEDVPNRDGVVIHFHLPECA